MSAPVTEAQKAHKALWAQLYNLAHCEIFEDFDESSDAHATQPIAAQAAQLIADSEARACAELRADVERLNGWCEELDAELFAERARLNWLMSGGVSRLHYAVSRAAIDAAMKEGA